MQLEMDFEPAPRPLHRSQALSQGVDALAAEPRSGSGGRQRRGAAAHTKGLLAELSVERLYEAAGGHVIGRRIRNAEGELDLVIQQDQEIVFVEVKARRTTEEALASLTNTQIRRIGAAALHWLVDTGRADALMRFDVACVDTWGNCEIVKNALFFDCGV